MIEAERKFVDDKCNAYAASQLFTSSSPSDFVSFLLFDSQDWPHSGSRFVVTPMLAWSINQKGIDPPS